MAVLPIRKYGDDVLRVPTTPVTDFDAALQKFIDDMVDTMYAAPGIGLAANQVGVSKRLMMIDLSVGKRPNQLHVCINPQILEVEGQQAESEGCLCEGFFSNKTSLRTQKRIAEPLCIFERCSIQANLRICRWHTAFFQRQPIVSLLP